MGSSGEDDGLEIDWARAVERLCFLFPPVIGVGAVGVIRELDPGIPGLGLGLVLFSTFGYTALTAGLVVALFFDARRIREAGSGWGPSPWFNAIFALLWGPTAGVVYLHRRHRHFGTPPGWAGWWVVVALSLAATLAGGVLAVVGIVLAMPGLVTSAVGIAGAIAVGAFPVAIHQDAASVCTRTREWSPNPGTYLGMAFVSLFVPPLQPALAAYYLFRRRRAVGLEAPSLARP